MQRKFYVNKQIIFFVPRKIVLAHITHNQPEVSVRPNENSIQKCK